MWKDIIDIVLPKVLRMISKSQKLASSLPLLAVTLNISTRDCFENYWLQALEIYCVKFFKEKQFSNICLISITRLLWVYLFRYPESRLSVVYKRCDYFLDLLPLGKFFV